MFDVKIRPPVGCTETIASELPTVGEANRVVNAVRKQHSRATAIVVSTSAGCEVNMVSGTKPDDVVIKECWTCIEFLESEMMRPNSDYASLSLASSMVHANACILLGVPEVIK